MRPVIVALVAVFSFVLAGVHAQQTSATVTISTILDENRSGSHEPDSDSPISEAVFLWHDIDGDSQYDTAQLGGAEEPYWNLRKAKGGIVSLTTTDLTSGDRVCAGIDFGPMIPESYPPYDLSPRQVCETINGDGAASIDLLALRWPALVVVWSWIDNNGNAYRDYAESGVAGQAFQVWVDEGGDGKLDHETATRGVTHTGAESGVGTAYLDILGPVAGNIVCIRAEEPPAGYHVDSLAAAIPMPVDNCHALTANGIQWQLYGNPVWPGRPAAMFIFGEAEGPGAIALPQTGGPLASQ